MKDKTCNRCWKEFTEADQPVYLDGDPYCGVCYQDILKEKAQYIERHQDDQGGLTFHAPRCPECGRILTMEGFCVECDNISKYDIPF